MYRRRITTFDAGAHHSVDNLIFVTGLLDNFNETIEQQCSNLSVKSKLLRITHLLRSILEKDTRSTDGVIAVIQFFEHMVVFYCDLYVSERDMVQFIVSVNVSDKSLNTFLNHQEKKKNKKVDEVISLWGKFRGLINLHDLKENNPKIYASYLSYVS